MSSPRNRRPLLSAAMSVVPEPKKRSSTRSPRRVTSWIASATSPVGLTVGCQVEILPPAPPHGVYRSIVPNIGAVAAMPAELDHVEMGRRSHPVDKNQLMFRPVKRSHASIG